MPLRCEAVGIAGEGPATLRTGPFRTADAHKAAWDMGSFSDPNHRPSVNKESGLPYSAQFATHHVSMLQVYQREGHVWSFQDSMFSGFND